MAAHIISTNCPSAIAIRNAKEAIVTYQNGKTERNTETERKKYEYTPLYNEFKDHDLYFIAQDIEFQKYYPKLVEKHKRGDEAGGSTYKHIHIVPATKIEVACKDGTHHHVECKDTPRIKQNMNGYTTFCLNKAVPDNVPTYVGVPPVNALNYPTREWSNIGPKWVNKMNTHNLEYGWDVKRTMNPTHATYAVCTEKDVSKCPSREAHRQTIQNTIDTHGKFDHLKTCPYPVHVMRTDFDNEVYNEWNDEKARMDDKLATTMRWYKTPHWII